MAKKLNLEYGSIFGFYWMFFAVASSFCSAYLLSMGYSNSQIGIILAAGSLASVVIQPLLADWADRSKHFHVIKVSRVVVIAMLAFEIIMCVMRQKSIVFSSIYVAILALMYSAQPLFNATCAKLCQTGEQVNFGIARAIGSVAYAILCMFLGSLVESRGVGTLRTVGITMLAVLLVVITLTDMSFAKAMKAKTGTKDAEAAVASAAPQEEINLLQFIKRNGLFALLCVGVVILYFQNNILNNYMLQILEGVGGNAEDMGRIFSYMAFIEIPGLVFFGKLRRCFGCRKLIVFSAFAFVAKLLAMYLAKSVAMVYVAQSFQLISFSIFLSGMVTFIDEIMERGEAVKGQALFIASTTVAGIFSSIFGGIILDKSGPHTMLLICVITCAIGAVIVSFLVGKIKSKAS